MKILLSFFAFLLAFTKPSIALAFTNNDTFNKEDTARINKLLKQGYSIRLSNPTQTIEIGKKALEVSKRIDYTYGMGEALRIIGIGYSYTDHLKEAVNCYLNALTYFTKNNDLHSQAKVFNNIGKLYLGIDNKNALLFCFKALAIANNLSFKPLIAGTSINIGVAFYKQNNYFEALKYYTRAENLFKEIRDTTNLLLCKQNIGVVYYHLKEYNKAYPILIDVVKKAKELGLNQTLASIDITLGELYIIKNKFNTADNIIKEGLSLAAKIKNHNLTCNFEYLRFELESKRKNYKLALQNLYSLYKEDSLAQDKGISTQIDLIREQAKADERKRENEILLQKQKLNQVELLASTVVTLLLLISIGLLILNLKRKGRNNIQLNTLNQEIIKQKQIADQINQHLEEIVFERTKELQSKNTKLKNYSSYLSHQIRGPVSSLIGLLNIEKGGLIGKPECIDMMNMAVNDIDKVIQEINQMLNDDIELDLS